MKEQLITFETAKLAKEKGFNWIHSDFYIDKNKNGDLTDLPCVPQSLLQKWLREKHNWYCNVELNNKGNYIPVLTYIPKNQKDTWDTKSVSYEDNLEFVLQEALKLI